MQHPDGAPVGRAVAAGHLRAGTAGGNPGLTGQFNLIAHETCMHDFTFQARSIEDVRSSRPMSCITAHLARKFPGSVIIHRE
jgi:hypothetical protein